MKTLVGLVLALGVAAPQEEPKVEVPSTEIVILSKEDARALLLYVQALEVAYGKMQAETAKYKAALDRCGAKSVLLPM